MNTRFFSAPLTTGMSGSADTAHPARIIQAPVPRAARRSQTAHDSLWSSALRASGAARSSRWRRLLRALAHLCGMYGRR